MRIHEAVRRVRGRTAVWALAAVVGLGAAAGVLVAAQNGSSRSVATETTADVAPASPDTAVLEPSDSPLPTLTAAPTPSRTPARPTPSPSRPRSRPRPSVTPTTPATKPGLPITRSGVERKTRPAPAPAPLPVLPPAVPLQPVSATSTVFGPDFPDPEVIYDTVRDEYYAYGTNTIGQNVQRLVSKDGRQWRRLPDALPSLPPDAVSGGTWAPNVRYNVATGAWVMTYAYLSRSTNREVLGVAVAPSPDATFVPRSAPLRSLPEAHVIDPDVIYVGGVPYLVSVEANATGNRFVAQMQSADGLHLLGAPFVLASAPYVLEGPTVLVVGDTVVVVFANGRTGAWNQPGYSTYYVEAPVQQVFGLRQGLDLRQARPLMVTLPGGPVATGEPATALDPLTGNLASTDGTLTFYTNDLHKDTFFGSEYDARYLTAYSVRIGDGSRRQGPPIALWSPPPTRTPSTPSTPKPSVSPRPPRPVPTPSPRPAPTPTRTPLPTRTTAPSPPRMTFVPVPEPSTPVVTRSRPASATPTGKR